MKGVIGIIGVLIFSGSMHLPAPAPQKTYPGVVKVTCDTQTGTAFSHGARLYSVAHVTRYKGGCKNGVGSYQVIGYEAAIDFSEMRGPKRPDAGEIACEGIQSDAAYVMVGYAGESNSKTVEPLTATSAIMGGATQNGNSLSGLRVMKGTTRQGMSGGPVYDSDDRIAGYVVGTLRDDRSVTLVREMRDTPLCAAPR